jgi:hypothetical protein
MKRDFIFLQLENKLNIQMWVGENSDRPVVTPHVAGALKELSTLYFF